MKIIFESKGLKILQIVWYLFKPYKLELAFLFLIMFVSGFLESLNLAALYPVINYGLEQNSQGIILKFFNTFLSLLGGDNLFLSSCILLIIITILAVGIKATNYFISYRLMVKMVAQYQKEILSKYIHADYDFFVRNQQGKLIYTGTIASKQAASMVLYTITAISDILSLSLIFSLLVLLTWQGAFAIVAFGTLYFLVVKRIMDKIIYRSGIRLMEADREKNVILNELITGIKTIKVFLGFGAWRRKYHSAVDRSMHNQFKMLMGRIFPESLMKMTLYILIATLGIFISYRASGDILPWIPLYGTFALVASRLFPAVQMVGNDLMVLVGSLPNTKEVYNLLNEDTKKISEGTKVLQNFCREISFRDIWFKFNNEEDFLFKGINFKIEKEEVTAIVGPSGHGKTTLINLLLRLFPLNKGQITIDGIDISEYTYKSYLAKIGYVSQETFIYNDTVMKNIEFGMENCNKEMIIEAAKQANAHAFIANTPDGYNTIVGDAGMKLSGGQRQRIAIARAILRKPEIMILDEATSALDNIAEKKVQDAINNIAIHTTVIVIAHRLSTIQNADKLLDLDEGKIIDQGRHDELIKKGGAYYHLYNMQLKNGNEQVEQIRKINTNNLLTRE